jgi:CDP-diacylglycerol--glycerol-3-phosphate 3-phosphatidyltransferase
LISAEFLAYAICFVKFKKEIATHSILSKGWALLLFATLLQIMITKNSTILFEFCFYVGIITRIEIMVIVLILRTWINDVPGIYQAILLRKGKPIRRNKLLNG